MEQTKANADLFFFLGLVLLSTPDCVARSVFFQGFVLFAVLHPQCPTGRLTSLRPSRESKQVSNREGLLCWWEDRHRVRDD